MRTYFNYVKFGRDNHKLQYSSHIQNCGFINNISYLTCRHDYNLLINLRTVNKFYIHMTSFIRQIPVAGSCERDKELLGLTRDRKVNDQRNNFSKTRDA